MNNELCMHIAVTPDDEMIRKTRNLETERTTVRRFSEKELFYRIIL